MTGFATVRYERHGAVALLTLNRPEVLNAFDTQLRADLLAAAQRAEADPEVRVVVLTGAGRAFCAGADLADATLDDGIGALIEREYRPSLLAIRESTKPWIAAVNGAARGAGVDMALMCDIRWCAQSASFAESYVSMGVISGDGGTWFLPRVVGVSRALELLWTGRVVDTAEAERIGIVSRVQIGRAHV